MSIHKLTTAKTCNALLERQYLNYKVVNLPVNLTGLHISATFRY